MALTEKGLNALGHVKTYFPTGAFSAADLSSACGEKIFAATLNAIVSNGYLNKLGGSPVRYEAIPNLMELLDNMDLTSKNGCNNSNLHTAKKKKNDEFYTRYDDIEAEVMKYRKYFRDKIVYLPCDDPVEKKSEFWSFFVNNFDAFGIKKLIATYYNENGKTYKIWIDRDTTNGGDIQQEDLTGDGDFRSPECVEILSECDIVCTNPPFSLMKEFLPLILKYNKQFLVIGPLTAITYKKIFPYVLEKRIWAGYNNVRHFKGPEGDERTVGNAFWYTNLPNRSLTDEIVLTKKYDSSKYDVFDERPDIININRVADIPTNYDGLMGVPISFFQGKYNPNQFEIVGKIDNGSDSDFDFCKPFVNGVKKFVRLVIRRKK